LDERQKPIIIFFLIRVGKQFQQKRQYLVAIIRRNRIENISNEISSGTQLSTLSVIQEVEDEKKQKNQ
jgi:hypothetical protein